MYNLRGLKVSKQRDQWVFGHQQGVQEDQEGEGTTKGGIVEGDTTKGGGEIGGES